MLTSFMLTSGILLLILTLSVLHLPLWLKRFFYWTPAWLQSAIIHFGYGGWIGGVTGHVVGGMLALPWFFVARYYIQPQIAKELEQSGFNLSPRVIWQRLLPAHQG